MIQTAHIAISEVKVSNRGSGGITRILNRRQALTSVALTAVGLAVSPAASEQVPGQSMEQKPGTAANQKKTSLHLTAELKSSPARVYALLLDSEQFAALTGLAAHIDPQPGGSFSLFQNQIEGRNVELVADHRIVQAWRPTHWDPGVYSIVRFELKPSGAGTTLTLDHTGFPEGDFDSLTSGWHEHYLNPMHKLFA